MSIYVKSRNEINKSKVVDYANEAITLFEPNYSLKGENIFKFEQLTYNLGNFIHIHGFKYNTHDKRYLIQKGLKRYSKYKNKNASSFIKAVNHEVIIKYKKQKVKYIIIFPINIDYRWMTKKRHVIIENSKIRFRTYDYIIKYFNFHEPKTLLSRIRTLDYPIFTYAIINQTERQYLTAMNKAIDKIELMRGIFNFVFTYGVIATQFGEPRPLSDIGPPKYGFAFSDRTNYVGHGDTYAHKEHYRAYRPSTFEEEKLQYAIKYINIYQKLYNSNLKGLLRQVLLLYNNALDDVNTHYSFLHFWQILEIIFSGGQNKHDVTVKRIKNIFKKDEKISDTIDIIANKRHLLVHEGRMRELEQEDIHRVKGYVDASINFLFNHTNKIKNRSNLVYLLDNVGKSKENIDNQISLLNYINKVKL